jgi:glutathione S-transferase
MKLYGSATSPFVRKVRTFALERGVAIDFTVEDPWARSERLLTLNPLGKVPVLVLDDGEVLLDSLAIIEHLDEVAPGDRWIPPSGASRREALRWHVLAHGLIDAVVARLLETRRPPEFRMADKIAREEERIASVLRRLETGAPLEPPSAGIRPDFPQVMIGVALRYMDFRYPHEWKGVHPRLGLFAEAMGVRPAFISTEPPA